MGRRKKDEDTTYSNNPNTIKNRKQQNKIAKTQPERSKYEALKRADQQAVRDALKGLPSDHPWHSPDVSASDKDLIKKEISAKVTNKRKADGNHHEMLPYHKRQKVDHPLAESWAPMELPATAPDVIGKLADMVIGRTKSGKKRYLLTKDARIEERNEDPQWEDCDDGWENDSAFAAYEAQQARLDGQEWSNDLSSGPVGESLEAWVAHHVKNLRISMGAWQRLREHWVRVLVSLERKMKMLTRREHSLPDDFKPWEHVTEDEKKVWRNLASWRTTPGVWRDPDDPKEVWYPGRQSWWEDVDPAEKGFLPLRDWKLARRTFEAIMTLPDVKKGTHLPLNAELYAKEPELLFPGVEKKRPTIPQLVEKLQIFVEENWDSCVMEFKDDLGGRRVVGSPSASKRVPKWI